MIFHLVPTISEIAATSLSASTIHQTKTDSDTSQERSRGSLIRVLNPGFTGANTLTSVVWTSEIFTRTLEVSCIFEKNLILITFLLTICYLRHQDFRCFYLCQNYFYTVSFFCYDLSIDVLQCHVISLPWMQSTDCCMQLFTTHIIDTGSQQHIGFCPHSCIII